MSRSDRQLALEPLEAADADTVRGSTLISQTNHSDHDVQRCPVTVDSLPEGGRPRSARGFQQSSLESAFSRVYRLFRRAARPEACAASQSSLERAFSGV